MLVGMRLLCWRPNWIRSCLRTRLLWLPPRVAFFLKLETHVIIARLCLLLPTPLALSPQKATPVLTTTLALSSQGHSLDLSTQMSPSADPVRRHQLRALWGSRLISLLRKSALQQADQPRARRRKGPTNVDCGVIQSRRLRVPSLWGSVSSSALLPWPRRRLQSSSSVALAS
jgi:hypothetical protein